MDTRQSVMKKMMEIMDHIDASKSLSNGEKDTIRRLYIKLIALHDQRIEVHYKTEELQSEKEKYIMEFNQQLKKILEMHPNTTKEMQALVNSETFSSEGKTSHYTPGK